MHALPWYTRSTPHTTACRACLRTTLLPAYLPGPHACLPAHHLYHRLVLPARNIPRIRRCPLPACLLPQTPNLQQRVAALPPLPCLFTLPCCLHNTLPFIPATDHTHRQDPHTYPTIVAFDTHTHCLCQHHYLPLPRTGHHTHATHPGVGHTLPWMTPHAHHTRPHAYHQVGPTRKKKKCIPSLLHGAAWREPHNATPFPLPLYLTVGTHTTLHTHHRTRTCPHTCRIMD